MKLGIVCHAHFGGSGVIATELGLRLAEHGHEVHFVCAKAPPRLDAAARVTLHEVPNPSHPLFPQGEYTLALASTLRALEVDLLHVHYAIPLAVSAALAREMGARWRWITTVHGTDVLTLGREPPFHAVVQHALQRSDLVTAPSDYLAREAARHFGVAHVDVVSNFVDTDHFVPSAAGRGEVPVVVHNSNFRSLKRVTDVIRIFAAARAATPCTLWLLGDGPERAAAQALVTELSLGEAVRFHGEQLEVAPLLQRSAVFLMPSEVESFGLAALEAMSCGVPVVATQVGGLPEVVLHGETGFLREVGAVEAMAADVVALLREPALHHRLSAAARARAVTHFRAAPLIAAWETLYRKLT